MATFETGQDCKVYRNDKRHHVVDHRVTNNNDGASSFTIGGLANYANHHIDAYIGEVRVYDKVLSDEEVATRYEDTCERYKACS